MKNFNNVLSSITSKLPKIPATKNISKSKKINDFFAKLEFYTVSLVKLFSKILTGAILLFFLAGIVPELREILPSFYRLVDVLLTALEWISMLCWQMIDQIIHFF